MEVGFIAPVGLLEELCITKTHYCLPSLVLKSQVYRNFYSWKREEGRTLILDSRTLDPKRTPEDSKVLVEALKTLKPSILITPSVMFKKGKTEEAFNQTMDLPLGKYKLAGCLEGSTQEEVLQLLDFYKRNIVDLIALPAHLYNIFPPNEAYKWVDIFIDNWNTWNEVPQGNKILVTSFPVNMGLKGRINSGGSQGLPPIDLTLTDRRFLKIAKRNIEEVLNYYD